jgi:hypothetical protein
MPAPSGQRCAARIAASAVPSLSLRGRELHELLDGARPRLHLREPLPRGVHRPQEHLAAEQRHEAVQPVVVQAALESVAEQVAERLALAQAVEQLLRHAHL